MGLLGEEEILEVRERLKEMPNPVKLIHFTQELNLEYGRETRLLLEELAALSDKLSLEVYNFLLDAENGTSRVAHYRGYLAIGRPITSSRRARVRHIICRSAAMLPT